MPLTTRTQIPAEVNNLYNRDLLERAVPALVHQRWAQVRDIPKNSGTDTIKFRRYGALATNTTPLTEGVTPAGKQLSSTEITAQVQYYGDYVTLSGKLQYETYDPILSEAAEVLGEQAGESLEEVCRDVLAAGTTVQYAGAAVSRVTVAAGMLCDRSEVLDAVLTLKGNDAKHVTSMVNPSTGYNTDAVMPAFIGIVHPQTTRNLKDATDYVPVANYSQPGAAMMNEVGKLDEVRFVETTKGKVFTGSGAAGIDVYATLIIARHAYGVTRLSGEAMRNIVKPLGSAGTEDPLDQRATSGWKATFVAKILNQNFLLRIEHAN